MGIGTSKTPTEIQNLRDKDQKTRKIIIDETGRSFFIDAGAGAGKTTLLVSRIKTMLENGIKDSSGNVTVVEPSEIVVITFTNAAAAEIRDRIADALRNSARKVNIDEMNISTIHSFCHTLISERNFDLGLGMSVELMENVDSVKVRSEYFDDYFRNINSQNLSVQQMIEELKEIIGFECRGYLKTCFMNMADREMAEYPSLNDTDPKGKRLLDYTMDDFYQMAYDCVPKVVAAIDKPSTINSILSSTSVGLPANTSALMGELYAATFKTKMESSIVAYNQKDYKGCFEILNFTDKQLGKTYKKNRAADTLPLAKAYHSITDEIKKIVEEYKALKTLVIVRHIVDKYQKERDPLKLSNDALLYRTAELMSKPDAVKYFQNKYKYLLVDEYQDTDDAQNALVWNLARDYEKEPVNPDSKYILPDKGTALRRGALVVVGDEKQAIYRFRGADSTLFTKMRDKMLASAQSDPAGVEVVTLSVNYRSNEKIIDWANEQFFDNVMRKNPAQEMVQSNERESNNAQTLQGVFKTDIDGPEELSRLISSLVNSNIDITVKEKDPQTQKQKYINRRIKYSDIMVLLYDKFNLPEYSDTLRQNGIPVRITGTIDDGKLINEIKGKGTNAEKTVSVNELYAVVKKLDILWDYLTDTSNKAYLVNAAQVVSKKEYYDETDKSKKKEKIDLLKSLASKIRILSPLGKFGYIMKHLEILFPDLTEKIKDKQKRLVNYQMLQSRMNNVYEYVLSKNPDSMQQISDAIKEYLAADNEKEAALGEDVNEVRLMNLHKAKGLQAPIVIVANRSNEDIYKHSNEYKDGLNFYPIISCRKEYRVLDAAPESFRSFSANASILTKALEADQEDIDRKSYVEATRAGEVLIYMTPNNLSSGTDPQEKAPYHMPQTPELLKERDIYKCIDELVKMVGEANKTGTVESNESQQDAGGQQGGEAVSAEVSEANADANEKLKPYAPEDLWNSESWEKKRAEVYIKKNPSSYEKKSEKINRDSSSEERPNGNIFGTVMHRCFELMAKRLRKLGVEEARNSVRIVISLAMRESWKDISENARTQFEVYLKKQMDIFLTDGNWLLTEILNAKEIYPEYEYSYMTTDSETKKKIWMNGTVDLIIERNDGHILIVDYKSDEKSAGVTAEEFKAELMKKYEGQLGLYRDAVEYISNLKKIDIKIYSMYEKEVG